MTEGWIPEDEWRTIVEHAPIVSVDLLVRFNGGLIFGKRENEPAAGYWFIPGGRVQKRETREEAVHRIAGEELGADVRIIESLGAYEHIYDTADVDGVGGKHYLANGFVVEAESSNLVPDDQHSDLKIFSESPEPLHEYVRQYLQDASTLPEWP
ncbi:NUDIX domain-containing protein [Natrinema sp. H-ect4]|uniref:NUDIX domain-containing protein n=1 Tax=Natrinema sp. H-ect4 TaxID=3242699 RepID=UPI0035A9690C